MKINTSIPSVTTNDVASRAKPAAAGSQKSAASSAQVELSSLATHLQDAATAADAQLVNAARVAEIKQAISEGRFHINPERIADGLLASVREMLSRQQG